MQPFFQKHKYHIVIFLELLILALVSGYYAYREPPTSTVDSAPPPITVTVRVDQPQTQQARVESGTAVFTLMETMRATDRLSFHARDFGGSLGKFIDEINGVKNTSDHFWIYYINNKKASVGVSNYVLQPDDVITWKYETHEDE